MTNPINLPHFVPGGPPRIRRTNIITDLEGMQALHATGWLEVGEELSRARDGQIVQTAIVLVDGPVRIGRRTFESPTPAAKHALGVLHSGSGWVEWTSTRDGLTLEQERAQAGLDPR